jgi:peroxiredoxin
MARVNLNKPAPDFELADFNGKSVRLSDYRGKANVLLVFNRGFT